jgi:hypothetical protein
VVGEPSLDTPELGEDGMEEEEQGEVEQEPPAAPGYRELAVDGSSRLELPLLPSEGDCTSALVTRRHLVTRGEEAIPQLDGGEEESGATSVATETEKQHTDQQIQIVLDRAKAAMDILSKNAYATRSPNFTLVMSLFREEVTRNPEHYCDNAHPSHSLSNAHLFI